MQLMKDWKTRFGMGARALVNQATNSGMIGRARRMFNRWWNKQKLAQQEIDRIKRKREEEKLRTQQFAAKFLVNDQMAKKREVEMERRRKAQEQRERAHSEDAFSDTS